MVDGYEVWVHGAAADDDVLKRLVTGTICPVEEHDGPCEVPWSLTLTADSALVLALYCMPGQAEEIADRVRRVVGDRVVVVRRGREDGFGDLRTQYEIESRA
ncbi:hypothetical protein FB561_6277 [Kribbella amoyensis]|uniref:Uncharacterized protein n=1 Tax=Kribbella amoyensis TaxID=996641 RepID=A0A561B7N3_9ACTN|nr:hypothetical protein [Kribbella amoyensis]TWD74843.1 hypothetical protein FB561_6277 [Kribbella amoyensis]